VNYFGAFDVSKLALGTLTLSTAGHSDIVVNLSNVTAPDANSVASPRFFHLDWTGTMIVRGPDPAGSRRLKDFASLSYGDALNAALEAAATAASWPSSSSLTFDWDSTSFFNYVITYDASVTAVFSTAAGAAFLGFASTTPAAGTTVIGTHCPMYVVSPTLSSTSPSGPDYEPAAIANHLETEDGSGYGMTRGITPIYSDWVQQFEKREKAERAFALAAHPWTLQHLVESCRGQWPFAVQLGSEIDPDIKVYFLRSEGTVWKPLYASPGNAAQLHVPFKAVLQGTVVGS
jgi:hypothetical protein